MAVTNAENVSDPSAITYSTLILSETTSHKSTNEYIYHQVTKANIFFLSSEWILASTCYLSVVTSVALLTNIFLIVIIFSSPNLRTPPNSHLINICFNDLLLCVSMLLSICLINLPYPQSSVKNTLAFIQGFITLNTFLQYSQTFAAIGYFRYKTFTRPVTSLKLRRRIIRKSLIVSWTLSIVISLAYNIAFINVVGHLRLGVHPFMSNFYSNNQNMNSAGQLAMTYLLFVAFVVCIIAVIVVYYRICKALGDTKPVGKNRVSPWQGRRKSTTSMNPTDRSNLNRGMYVDNQSWMRPFVVSEHFAVQYNKAEDTVNFDEIFALEYPQLAMKYWLEQKNQLTATPSMATVTSNRQPSPDFTDITPSGELARFQKIKNSSALRMQSMKNDRVSLTSAMRNTLIMFSAFLLFSVTLFSCNIPGVLSQSDLTLRVKTLIISHLIFSLNSLMYPIWFLIFSKRVKKCTNKMLENVLLSICT